jgi:hypothetical protein
VSTIAAAGERRDEVGAAGARRLVAAVAPVLVGLVGFAVARSALLPGQGFWDTGEFQAVAPLLGTAHPTGFPTYVLLGWLASLVLTPLGEPALRMNLLSAILLGLAAGLTVVLVRQLVGRTSVAVAAGLLLALTPLAWRMGTFADPHTLHVALLAGLLVLLVGWERRRRARAVGADRWLVAAAVLYGVMLGNHGLTALLAPGIALYLLAVEPGIVRRPRLVATCAIALVGTAAALYLELPIRAAMGAPLVYGHPDTLDGFLYVVLGQQFGGLMTNPFVDLGRKAADLAALAGQQLGVLAAFVPAAAVLVAFRLPRYALLTVTWMVVTCWFAASFRDGVVDRYYLGPLLIAVTWLGAAAGLVVDALVGAAQGGDALASDGPQSRSPDVSTPGEDPQDDRAGRAAGGAAAGSARAGGWLGARAPAAVLGTALALALLLPALLAAPQTAARADLGGDTRATSWSRWALQTVDRDAVVLSWWSYSTPLWYRTFVLGERPDVTIVDDRDLLDENLGTVDDVIRATVGTRPVYLVRYPSEIQDLETRWELEMVADPRGQQPIYRVVGPRPGGGSSAIPQAAAATMRP